jgi:hypothetical protein
MHTTRKWHKRLGNQVTFDLIDIGATLRAAIAAHNAAAQVAASMNGAGGSVNARLTRAAL